MLSAIAYASISSSVIPYSTLFSRARSLPQPAPGEPLLFPISIFSAANSQVLRARVPIDPITLQVWEPEVGKGVKIAGVPEEAAAIECEMPLEVEEDGQDHGGLLTGEALNSIMVDGKKVRYLSTALI